MEAKVETAAVAGLCVEAQQRNVFRLGLALIAGLAALRILFLALSPRELDVEEAQYWFWSLAPSWGYASKPPLIAWLIAAERVLCGDGELCLRIGSPLLHGATAVVIGCIAQRLAGAHAAFWSMLVYATAPGIWFSSYLITTDVPLLFFWSLALWALLRLREGGGTGWSILLGGAIGLGLLSKYAMLGFVLQAALYLLLARAARAAVRPTHLVVAGLIAAAFVAPNVIWNVDQGGATVLHTVANANWQGALLRVSKLLEFAGNQFIVAGPLTLAFMLGVLLWWRRLARRGGTASILPRGEALLLLACFCFPFLAAMLGQALMSRAHPNWGAPAYVSGLLLVVVAFLPTTAFRWVRLSVAVTFALTFAGSIWLAIVLHTQPVTRAGAAVLARASGWAELGQKVAALRSEQRNPPVLAFERDLLARIVYYARLAKSDIRMWSPAPWQRNQYELVAPLVERSTGRFLFITSMADPSFFLGHFERVRDLGTISTPLPNGTTRVQRVFLVENFGIYCDLMYPNAAWHSPPRRPITKSGAPCEPPP